MQFKTNKNFVNPNLQTPNFYGESNTEDLQTLLSEDIVWLQKFNLLIAELNKDLSTKKIADMIKLFTGIDAIVKQKTKKIRTYFVAGLTIHEDDDTVRFVLDSMRNKKFTGREMVAHFIKCCIYDLNLGIGFHPDTDFNDYIYKSGKQENMRCFCQSDAMHLNWHIEQCFDECNKLDLDIYEIALEIAQPLLNKI